MDNMEQVEENESIKMVIRQDNIEAKILKLYQDCKKIKLKESTIQQDLRRVKVCLRCSWILL